MTKLAGVFISKKKTIGALYPKPHFISISISDFNQSIKFGIITLRFENYFNLITKVAPDKKEKSFEVKFIKILYKKSYI